MRNEQDKYEVERKVVVDLADRAGLRLVEESLRKGNPDKREPDVYCICSGEQLFFEVAEACPPQFAEAIAEAKRNDIGVSAAWGEDGIEDILIKKLGKSYNVTEPVELILYTDGRNALPDDVLVSIAKQILSDGLGPFRRVWLSSEAVFLLGSTSSKWA